MSEREEGASGSAIVEALRGVSEGTASLVRHHVTLAAYELRADAIEAARDAAALIGALIAALIGYALLLLGSVGAAAWFGGIVGATLAALVLALIHLGGAALIVLASARALKRRGYGLRYARQEAQRSKAWAKETIEQVREESSSGPALLN